MATDTRHKMVVGAARLLAERGLQETSFSEVLELTGAPRGSIYHHFPRGKDELIEAAIELTGDNAVAVISSFEGLSVVEVTTRFIALWRSVLVKSEFSVGCAVLAVTISTDSPGLLDHAVSVFRRWRTRLAEVLTHAGVDADVAGRFAVLLVTAMEGAVVLSRAEKSLEPFEAVATQLELQASAMDPTDPSH